MNAKKRLYKSWKKLLSELLDPLLVYLSSSMGHLLAPVAGNIAWSCNDPRHQDRMSKILCPYFNHEIHSYFYCMLLTVSISDICTMNVTGCQCLTILQLLVHHGLFPTTPSQPRMAISIELLDFFRCLFEQSCDATNALSVALQSFYSCRSFISKNTWVGRFESLWSSDPNSEDAKGEKMQDGIRHGLSYTMQWYDSARLALEDRLDAAVHDGV